MWGCMNELYSSLRDEGGRIFFTLLITLLFLEILLATFVQCFSQLRLLSMVIPRNTASSSSFNLIPPKRMFAWFSFARGLVLRNHTNLGVERLLA